MTALLKAPLPRSPRSRLESFGPNWFASVMGTGIVANAAILLPVSVPGLHAFALGVWVIAAMLLITLVAVSIAHVRCHPAFARGHHRNLAMAPFYGAPAMACLTVGSGALLAGRPLLGTHAALGLDAVLWAFGTVGGLACAVAIPYLMFTFHRPRLEDVHGSWLMAVVAPMVSAAAGAGLIAHLQGQARLTMQILCAGCFGASLLLVAVLLPILVARLAFHGVGPAPMVPTLWIVLGPLGQSVTAAGLLATASQHPQLAAASQHPQVAAASQHHLLAVASVLYGVPVWSFALTWMALAAALTRRAVRDGLPFSLTWWSFTFPVGTMVTASSELAVHTHAVLFSVAAVGLFGLLIGAWLTVALRTIAGTLDRSLCGERTTQRRGRGAESAAAR